MSVFGYEELMRGVEKLTLLQVSNIRVDSIGKSVCGRDLPVIAIGRGPEHVHFNGAMHANEWITAAALMRFVYRVADIMEGTNEGGVTPYVPQHKTLWIAPMINPDGVEIVVRGVLQCPDYSAQLLEWNGGSHDFSGWKANVRGVDLNDQFPAHWQIERERRTKDSPGPRDFTGEAPLTEPEAIALAKFTEQMQFNNVFAFHTQGREVYWNYRGFEPPEAEQMAKRLANSSEGYSAVKLSDSDAGYKDWFIERFRRPGFTIELGLGVNPLPYEHFESFYQEAEPIMQEALLL